ncbi:hypothetical protein [Flavobacterium gyeonganense]|uniref:hypothetical protein n=1 Tax=Flavobacterium gyeonganense TaxID=1310418 RepID=UPI00241452AD|nr:hypothetical protein [Flavobacterium gyeonganense]
MIKYKENSQRLINVLLISVLAILLLFCIFKSNKEIVYVDNVKLFDGFRMTKEMKRTGEKEFNSRKSILDKLYSDLQSPTVSDAEKNSLCSNLFRGKKN